MKSQSDKLSIREYIAITILMVGTKGTDETPSMLYNQVQNAAWMIPLISGGLFFIPLILLLKTLSVFQGKNLFTVIQQLLGIYIGFVICLLIFLVTSLAISYESRTYTNIINSFYFQTTPNLIIYGILMLVSAYGAKKGIRLIWISLLSADCLCITILFTSLILSIQHSNINAIFPIWGPGKLEILKESTLSFSLFADFCILAALIPYMNSFKEFRNGTVIVFVGTIIQFSLAIMLFICLFDMSLKDIAYPFHTTTRYISIGSFLSNVETFFLPIWLMLVFIRLSAFLYISPLMFGQLFKIKNFEYLIPTLAAICLLIGMFPESPIDTSLGFKNRVKFIAGPTFSGICIILWLVALLKGKLKHQNEK
jgi:spore germination protein KB